MTHENLQMSPISKTSFLVGTFFAISDSKIALIFQLIIENELLRCVSVRLSYNSERKSSRLKNQKKHRYNQRKMEKKCRKMKVRSFFYTFDDSLILSMIVPDTYSCGKNRQSG